MKKEKEFSKGHCYKIFIALFIVLIYLGSYFFFIQFADNDIEKQHLPFDEYKIDQLKGYTLKTSFKEFPLLMNMVKDQDIFNNDVYSFSYQEEKQGHETTVNAGGKNHLIYSIELEFEYDNQLACMGARRLYKERIISRYGLENVQFNRGSYISDDYVDSVGNELIIENCGLYRFTILLKNMGIIDINTGKNHDIIKTNQTLFNGIESSYIIKESQKNGHYVIRAEI